MTLYLDKSLFWKPMTYFIWVDLLSNSFAEQQSFVHVSIASPRK